MPGNPVFSVVIPCYNYGTFLRGALESVFAQHRDDVQVLLVDDASDDDTPVIAKEYGSRIEYIRNERNLGAGGAWRVGLSRAEGRYVIKLDADDEFLPGHLDRVEQAFEVDPAIGAVIASVRVLKEDQGVFERQFIADRDMLLNADELRERLLRGFFFRMPGCVLRRTIMEQHEPPDPDLYQIHDWEYFLRVLSGHKAYLLREPGAKYRVHGASITATAQFDNRLFNDIQRWMDLSARPGDRHLEPEERRVLMGSCAELLLIGFGSKTDPRSYARYAYKYWKALGLSYSGGFSQFVRVHRTLATKILRKMTATDRPETIPIEP